MKKQELITAIKENPNAIYFAAYNPRQLFVVKSIECATTQKVGITLVSTTDTGALAVASLAIAGNRHNTIQLNQIGGIYASSVEGATERRRAGN